MSGNSHVIIATPYFNLLLPVATFVGIREIFRISGNLFVKNLGQKNLLDFFLSKIYLFEHSIAVVFLLLHYLLQKEIVILKVVLCKYGKDIKIIVK